MLFCECWCLNSVLFFIEKTYEDGSIKTKKLWNEGFSDENFKKLCQKYIELLKKGYKETEISKIVNVHLNTITKVKKLGMINQ